MTWQTIRRFTTPFVGLLLLAIVGEVFVYAFVEYGVKSSEYVGCYAYDGLVMNFECQGFVASNIVSLWLNWPVWLIYGPIFALFSLSTFVVAILAWLPLVVFIVSTIQVDKNKKK